MILIKADESQECLYGRCGLAHLPRWSEAARVNMLSIKICSNTAPVRARTGKVLVRSALREPSEMQEALAGCELVHSLRRVVCVPCLPQGTKN